MKRLFGILLCLIFVFSLSACAPGGYLNSTDGGITVSLPEKTDNNPQYSEEQKLILGKWNVVSITNAGSVTTYTDSYYHFSENGKCTVMLNGNKNDGGFSFNEQGLLVIDGSPVTYTIDGDTLTITTASGAIHLLQKVAEQAQ